jgi:hypothetical protein
MFPGANRGVPLVFSFNKDAFRFPNQRLSCACAINLAGRLSGCSGVLGQDRTHADPGVVLLGAPATIVGPLTDTEIIVRSAVEVVSSFALDVFFQRLAGLTKT